MQKLRQAVILAGGQGVRMRPFTLTMPKPMVPIAGRPFLEHLVELVKRNGIEEVVLLLGYLPAGIIDYFGDGSRFGVRIVYSVTPVHDETGTRIRKAAAHLDERFLLLYCDNYWPLNLAALSGAHEASARMATVTVYTNADGRMCNNIAVRDGVVTRYDKSRTHPELTGVDIGFFILEKKVLDFPPQDNFSFEEVVLPQLVATQQLAAHETPHRYYSIGSPERLLATEAFLAERKVIFLDRDGTLNEKAPPAQYIESPESFRFLPGVPEALGRLAAAGYELYVVTNQPGIGRGMMTHEQVADIHRYMTETLAGHGVTLASIYYCPHGWDDATARRGGADDRREDGCACRKPKPGMLFDAARDHHIDLTRAIVIGDDERDIEAGRAAGCRTMLVGPGRQLPEIVDEMLG